MTNKRGNPNWRRPIVTATVLITEFERQVRRLQLTTEMYISSADLRAWCELNKDKCYVPEWLLAKWQITTDLPPGHQQVNQVFSQFRGAIIPENLHPITSTLDSEGLAKVVRSREMDEGRKQVIGLMAAILASRNMQTADDLFGGPQGSPRMDKLIAASIQWAKRIMAKIDGRCGK